MHSYFLKKEKSVFSKTVALNKSTMLYYWAPHPRIFGQNKCQLMVKNGTQLLNWKGKGMTEIWSKHLKSFQIKNKKNPVKKKSLQKLIRDKDIYVHLHMYIFVCTCTYNVSSYVHMVCCSNNKFQVASSKRIPFLIKWVKYTASEFFVISVMSFVVLKAN